MQSLSFGGLYLTIVAMEVGRGGARPDDRIPAYLAVSGLYALHYQAIDRIMKDAIRLSTHLGGGLMVLDEAGVDIALQTRNGALTVASIAT